MLDASETIGSDDTVSNLPDSCDNSESPLLGAARTSGFIEGARSRTLDGCEEMNALIPMPWTLLSGGGDFESFFAQVVVALEAGAAGCMVGRALWGEAAQAPNSDRPRVLKTLIAPRLSRLHSLICNP